MPSYRVKSRKLQIVRTAVFLVVGVSVGGFLFWYGLGAFRSSAAQTQEQAALAAQEQAVTTIDPLLDPVQAALLNNTVPLYSACDSQATGRMTRTFGQGFATIDILAYLPMLDTAAYGYEIWMVKDGLADVVSLGELSPRADGSWIATFMAGPATGMADPHDYTTLVIMQEPRDGNGGPSGMKIAQGKWNE